MGMANPARDLLISSQFFDVDRQETVSATEQQLLGTLFHNPGLKQATLTNRLTVAQPSISRLVRALENRGLIARGGVHVTGKRGKPSSTLSLNPGYAFGVGVSITADAMLLCLIDFAGKRLADLPALPIHGDVDCIIQRISKGIDSLLDLSGVSRNRIFGIGVAITGYRVGPGAIFNPPESLDALAMIDLEAEFSSALGLPVWAENDGKVAALAECMLGIGRQYGSFAYYYIATGVGGGIVVDGKLFRGHNGNAGEFGGAQPLLGAAQPASLEKLRTILVSKGYEIPCVNSLVESFDPCWNSIDDWIEGAAPTYSMMFTATSAILDTEAIILGGLIPNALAEKVIKSIHFLDESRRDTPPERPVILPSELRDDPAAHGAALLPFASAYFAFN